MSEHLQLQFLLEVDKLTSKKYAETIILFFFYLFVYSRHEVHSMNTHTLQNAG